MNTIEALKERDINPNAQRYLSKIHAWIAKRRDLSLPAVINPHLNHYYKLYNRGAPDTSKQDFTVTYSIRKQNSNQKRRTHTNSSIQP